MTKMTMDANELRALADALEPMAKAPRFEDFDVPGFCAWVRACADEKPVGVYVHRPAELRYGVEWLVGDPMPNGTQLFTHPAPAAPAVAERGPWSADQRGRHVWVDSDDFTHDVRLVVNGDFESDDQKFAYAQEIARRLNAAPAAPQAEPCIGNDPACPCQDGDACHYKDGADGTKAWPVPQAEPKREPLSDDEISKLAWKQNLWTDGMIEFSFVALAREVERAHGIGGSDAE